MKQEKKRYLIVGANSFLSKSIIEGIGSKHYVAGLYHVNRNNFLDSVEYYHISKLNDLPDNFDTIFLISAYIPIANTDVDRLNDVNIQLVARVCEKFKNSKIVYASSVSIYGNARGVLAEASLSENPSLYGISKLKAEDIVNKQGAYSIIRISSMYGEGMNLTTFIPKIIESAINNKCIKILGTGTRLQNYIHVSDVAKIFIKASQQERNDTYLAVAEASFTNLEIANNVKALTGAEIVFEGKDDSHSFQYDATHTYKELGFKPTVTIGEGLLNLLKWQQKMY